MSDFDENTPIGEGTTTLNWLIFKFPWLGELLKSKEEEISLLKAEIAKWKERAEKAEEEVEDFPNKLRWARGYD